MKGGGGGGGGGRGCMEGAETPKGEGAGCAEVLEITNYACMRDALFTTISDICVRRSLVNS